MGSVPMPRDLSEEAVARMLRAAWIADEPIPAAGSFDEIGPLMRKAWMATARAVRALVEREVAKERASTREKVREAAAHPRERVVTQSCECCSDVVEITPDEIVSRVLGEEAPRG